MAAYSDTTKLNLTQFSLHSPPRIVNLRIESDSISVFDMKAFP